MSSTEVEALESLLQQKGRPRLDVKLALTRLSAEIADRTAKGSLASYDFLVSAVQAVGRIKGTTHADLRLSCLFESSLFFYRLGFAHSALQTADHANRLARRIGSKPWCRKADTLSGIVHMEAGNLADALVHLCSALKLARELDDRFAETAVLINMSSVFNYGGIHNEAINCLLRAIDLCREPSLQKYEAVAYCDLAQCYLALEQHEKAFTAITRSLLTSDEPRDGSAYFSRTIREFTYVQAALEVGKLARAREHAAACRHFSQWGNNPRCRTLAQIAVGLCEIRGGDVDKGLGQLQTALATCGDFISSRVDVLNALVKAYDEAGRPEEALAHLNELLVVVRRLREQSLAVVLNATADASLVSVEQTSDVRALVLREARLKAKVAERELLNSQLEMLERLAITADLKNEPSGQHGYRVGRLAGLLSEKAGMGLNAARDIEIAGRLHDIGKIGLPDRILLSSSTLREAEQLQMRTHTMVGAEILGKSRFDRLQLAEQVARHHHEYWDGTGYPSRLSGKRIPIHARIVALADVFDALTHGRAYAPAWSIDRAIEEIRSRRGTQFDPELTDVFLELIDELRRQHHDLDGYLAEASRNSPFLQAREKIRLMLEGGRQPENMAAAAAETVH
jgi:putative two-component system response regulator